jgi:hypothetical protein
MPFSALSIGLIYRMGAEELFMYHCFLVAFDIVGATIKNHHTLQKEGLPVSGSITHPNPSTPPSPPSSQTSWDDEEEVSNTNTNTNNQSLAAAVWCLLNPSDKEPPMILTAMDIMRIDPLDHHKKG